MYDLVANTPVKIVKSILRNPGINLRGVIEETRLSPNQVSKCINSLVERGIVKEEKLEKRRVYLRNFYIDCLVWVHTSQEV